MGLIQRQIGDGFDKEPQVKNFKSIKHLDLDCRRANIFVDKLGTGKSNILETIGLLSHCSHGGQFGEFVRFESMLDLFFEGEIGEGLEIVTLLNTRLTSSGLELCRATNILGMSWLDHFWSPLGQLPKWAIEFMN